MKRILHIDMNSFYASCELKNYQDIYTRPLIVVGLSKKRHGIISAASYGARKYNITSAMTLNEALKLCPNVQVADLNMNLYKKTSKKIMDFLKQEYKFVEQASIDEAYIDISDKLTKYGSEYNLAQNLQKQIRNIFNLPCSIGIGDNKLQAKMSSNKKKPLGIFIVNSNNFVDKFGEDNISKVHGIGKSSQKKYYNLNIITINDALKISLNKWKKYNFSLEHYNYIRGIGSNTLDYQRYLINKSISKEHTLEQDIVDEDEIFFEFENTFEIIYNILISKNYLAKVVNIKVKYFDFSQKQKSQTLNSYTNDKTLLKNVTNELIVELVDFEKPLRLISVGFSTLKTAHEYELEFKRYFKPFEKFLR